MTSEKGRNPFIAFKSLWHFRPSVPDFESFALRIVSMTPNSVFNTDWSILRAKHLAVAPTYCGP